MGSVRAALERHHDGFCLFDSRLTDFSIGELANACRQRDVALHFYYLLIDWHVSVAAEDMEAVVRRVGVPWGGLGLFVNVAYQQRLVELRCDAFIAGESDSDGFGFAVDSGIPMIETSHEVSENWVTGLAAGTPPAH